jgi:hypothetical protein
MGTLKTTNIQTITGSGTLTLGTSGETLALGSGVTSNILYPAFEARLSADQNISDATYTTVNIDTEIFDTDSAFDTSTYRFTPQVAGKYFVYGGIRFQCSNSNNLNNIVVRIDKNGTVYRNTNFDPNNDENIFNGFVQATVDMNGSSDYLTLVGYLSVTSGTPRFDSGTSSTYFGAYRIGS